LELRLREENEQAVAMAVAEWKRAVEALRRGHAAALDALRREQHDQIAALQAAAAQELARKDEEHQGVLARGSDEVAAIRTQAAQLNKETRQRYELGLAQAQARHTEALRTLESQLRDEKDQAAGAIVAE